MDNFFAGELVTELAKELGRVIHKVYMCRASADHLRNSVESLFPIIQEIRYSGVELPQLRQSQLSELAQQLRSALDLARKASASPRWNVYRSLQLSRKMDKIDGWITRWINRQMPAHLLADIHHLRADMYRIDLIERNLFQQNQAMQLQIKNNNISSKQNQLVSASVAEMMEKLVVSGDNEEGREGRVGVGMKIGKERVKEMLIGKGGERVVGICGIGGSGKTTLAKELCRDPEIKNYFGNRIFFETVSQSPNLESLKLKLWEQITGNMVVGVYNHIPQWQIDLGPASEGPVLVVLDDVWSASELEELVFKIPNCNTLIASRFKFPMVVDSTYELELLTDEEALSLFCYSAFQQETIPMTADKKLVKKVVEECKGLPLALKVIGASLRGQPPKIWASAKNRLSQGETISESHENKLLDRMALSIECLKSKVRECFLDLGSFPEDKKIRLDVLINLWMEIYDLVEEDAFAILVELSNKSLLTLVKDTQNRAGDIYSNYSELSVTQHDVLRDLALYMTNRENLNSRKRLIMASREDGLPKEWHRNKDKQFDAQIVSIHTGTMKESDWFEMNFPKAEVLILNMSSGTYFMPSFIATMPSLKVLIMINSGNSCTVLHNLSVFTCLPSLRSVWFEKISVPPLQSSTIPLQDLRKVSLVLCELKHSMKDHSIDLEGTLPQLTSLTIDHCIDLTELPSEYCNITTLKSLSVSNCHELRLLPDELSKLSDLEILRIYACPGLKKLPQSICQLKRLKYLDISQCVNLRNLPDDLGQLTALEKIDMRECSLLKSIPCSSAWLKSLGHVVCDDEIAVLWKEVEVDVPDLRVQVVEESFNLDWLVE